MKDKKIYYCVGCGELHPAGNFYKSFMSDHANGRLFYCKDYMKSKCYNSKNGINKEEFEKLLRQLNVAYLPDLLDASINSGKDIIGAYFSTYNGLTQYKGMTWDDGVSLRDTVFEDDESVQNTPDVDNFVVTPIMVSRWGVSYTKQQIKTLEKFYNDIFETHDIKTPQHRTALIMIAKLQLKMDAFLDSDDIDSYSKHHKEYQKLMQTSGLRPIDKTGMDEETGMRSFSQIFEEVERDGFITPNKSKESQDIVDRTIQYMMNYTLKLLDRNALAKPPKDTPKEVD